MTVLFGGWACAMTLFSATEAAADGSSGQPPDSEEILYPAGLEAVVDVTKAPYRADPTGRTDCTAALIRAVDDVMRPDEEALKQTLRTIKEQPQLAFWYRKLPFAQRQQFMQANPLAVIGQERVQGIFPYRNSPARILYFPKGIYLVSDTITYSFPDMVNRQKLELAWRLHFRGENREGSIIRLKENSPGFGPGADKPVVSFIHDGRRSNVAMQNSFEDLTIEVGAGNPGAAGLNFFGNNCGVVRRTTIRATGPEKGGGAGLEIKGMGSTATLISEVRIEGFDDGFRIEHASDTDNVVIEHATLSGQHMAGLLLKDRNASVRALVSDNAVPAVRMEGSSTLALLDSHLTGTGPAGGLPAIELKGGCLLLRDVDTAGYGRAVERPGLPPAASGAIHEYLSHPWVQAFADGGRPPRLPVEETPFLAWPKPVEWVSVNSFGAKGDGFTDDTAAIQAAMNSGRLAIYFQPGTYLIEGTVTIPPSVQRVNFMYADLVSGGPLLEQRQGAAFRVRGESPRPLLLEDLFAFELFYGPRLVEQASRRTLVLRDMQTQAARMYFNSVPGGKVFIENCACADPVDATLPGGFTFTGQQVWARQLNPERCEPKVLNDGSRLWVLGFRMEPRGQTGFMTTNGGTTEVMGGHFSFHGGGKPVPQVINRDSATTIFGAAMAFAPSQRLPDYDLVKDTRGSETRGIPWSRFPSLKPDEVAVIYSSDPCTSAAAPSAKK
jgi:hypothetical protein